MVNPIACPKCRTSLNDFPQNPNCPKCVISFPKLGGIPILHSCPPVFLTEWKTRTLEYFKYLDSEKAEAEKALSQTTLKSTQLRLKNLSEACTGQKNALQHLLSELLDSKQKTNDLTLKLNYSLYANQTIDAYLTNIFRDWAWGEKENAESLEACLAVLGKTKVQSMLVLGAGSGKLSLDLHEALKPETSLVMDINPLLLLVMKKLVEGEKISLFQIKDSAKDSQGIAPSYSLKNPGKRPEGLHWILGNALDEPIAESSLDLVVTPWLLDVIPENSGPFIARINRILKPGGLWLNFGPLVFYRRKIAHRHTHEEIREILPTLGFENQMERFVNLPYLSDPTALQNRRETLWCFSAKKTREADKPSAFFEKPDWLRDPSLPVLLENRFFQRATAISTQAIILSLVDGKRSIKQMAQEISAHQGIPEKEMLPVLLLFFEKFAEQVV